MNLIAITNAISKTKSTNTNTLNIGIKNNKIIALGYLPDDEEYKEINAKNHQIIENTFNIIDEFHPPYQSYNNGITLHVSSFSTIHILKTYTFLKEFKSMNFNQENTYILSLSLSELLYIIQESDCLKDKANFHLIIDLTEESLASIEAISLHKNISIGFILNKNNDKYKNQLIKLIKQEKVTTLSSKNTPDLIPSLFKLFNESNTDIISKLLTPYFLKKELKNQLLIGTKPSITFIKKSSPFSILCTVKKGEIYKENKGDSDEL